MAVKLEQVFGDSPKLIQHLISQPLTKPTTYTPKGDVIKQWKGYRTATERRECAGERITDLLNEIASDDTDDEQPMKAFSYIRWSSDRQSLGDSLRRQTELAERYAKIHSLELDTSSYQDHGISAYKGKNLEGNLGNFLKAIDGGVIPTPCTLLVEALDRITRNEIDVALELFLSIIKRGVTIVVLQSDQIFSKESIKKDRGISLIIAISMLVQGHEDSSKRAMRIKESYEGRRQRGEISSNKFPSWLRKVDKKTFAVIPEKAATVNRIFDLALEGNGSRIIARILHQEKVPTLQWAKEWNQALVSGLLRSPSVYGCKDDQEGYYPPIMTKDKFMMTVSGVQGRKWKGGRPNSVPNIFAGLSYCSECGQRMRYIPSGVGNPYMRCRRAVDKQECNGKLYPYNACEEAFIYVMTRKAGLDLSGEFIAEQKSQRPALVAEIETLKDRQKRLLKLASLADGVEAIADELNAVQAEITTITTQINNMPVPISRKEIKDHKDLFDAYQMAKENNSADLVDIKRKVRVAMARLFKKIEFGVGKDRWSPIVFITLVDGTRAIVNVGDFLGPRSIRAQQKIKV